MIKSPKTLRELRFSGTTRRTRQGEVPVKPYSATHEVNIPEIKGVSDLIENTLKQVPSMLYRSPGDSIMCDISNATNRIKNSRNYVVTKQTVKNTNDLWNHKKDAVISAVISALKK